MTPAPAPNLRARRRRPGFTLPEVLATLVLIGLVLPAAMKGASLALAASDDARKKVEAAALAETKLADLTADVLSGVPTAAAGGDFGPDHAAFAWEGSSVASADAGLTEVSVRVYWTARGQERSVTLSSMVYATGTSTAAGAAGTGGTP